MGVASVGLIVLAGCSDANSLVTANVTLLTTNSTATRTAKAILHKLNHGDLKVTVSNTPCSLVTSGGIGSLKAPFDACPTSTAEGRFVTFSATADPDSGLAYTDRRAETFLDECYTPVSGDWFVWMKANLENPAQPCPGEWRFHGGP